VRTSEPTSKPGVSISTRRTVVPQQASPPQAADTRSKDEAPPAPKAASAPTP
jgi:hypothetical protein